MLLTPDPKAPRAGGGGCVCFPSHIWVLLAPPTVPVSPTVPFCRKPVSMTKATVNYRQEKTHMMSAVDRSFTDQSTLQEDERLGLSFMDAPGYSPRGKYLPSQPPGSQDPGQSPAKASTSCVSTLAQKSGEYSGCVGAVPGGAYRICASVVSTNALSPLTGYLLFTRLESGSWGGDSQAAAMQTWTHLWSLFLMAV